MKLNTSNTHHRTNASAAGIFYLIAAAAPMLAWAMFQPVLHETDYLMQSAEKAPQVILGVLFDLITVISVAGTGIMLYPYLRRHYEHLALGYFIFRLMEAVLILIGLLAILSMLTLSHTYKQDTNPSLETYQLIGSILRSIHAWTYIVGPNFMLGINTFIYSFIFFKSRLVPRKLSVTGLFAATAIFMAALLEMFGVIEQVSGWGALFALPVFIFEMTLAVWLIAKGFNKNTMPTWEIKAAAY